MADDDDDDDDGGGGGDDGDDYDDDDHIYVDKEFGGRDPFPNTVCPRSHAAVRSNGFMLNSSFTHLFLAEMKRPFCTKVKEIQW